MRYEKKKSKKKRRFVKASCNRSFINHFSQPQRLHNSTDDIRRWCYRSKRKKNSLKSQNKITMARCRERDKRNARNLLTILASMFRQRCKKQQPSKVFFFINAIMLIQAVMKIQIGWMKLGNDTWVTQCNDILIVFHLIRCFLIDEIWSKYHAPSAAEASDSLM